MNADRVQVVGLIEEPGQTNDGIEAQQLDGNRRIVQIHITVPQLRNQIRRQCVHIDFEAHRQSRVRTHARPNTTQGCTFDRVVQLQRAAPKGVIAKCIEPECVLSFGEQLQSMGLEWRSPGVVIRGNLFGVDPLCDLIGHACQGSRDANCEYAPTKCFHRNPPSSPRAPGQPGGARRA